MTTQQTPTQQTPATLDEVSKQVDALLKQVTAPVAKTLTKPDFETYAKAQADAATTEIAAGKIEEAKKRLDALKGAIETAKASWDSGATTVALPLYQDPMQTTPTQTTGDVSAPGTSSGVQSTGPGSLTGGATSASMPGSAPAVGAAPTPGGGDAPPGVASSLVAKSRDGFGLTPTPMFRTLLAIAKSTARVEKSATQSTLIAAIEKADGGAVLIQKAGEALAILQKIQGMFNVQLDDPSDLLDCELRWQVGDMISALQQAAKLETVLAAMSGAIAKSEVSILVPKAPIADATHWPRDLASVEVDREGVMKDKNLDTSWGSDAKPSPV